jgi:hypothetical protein
MSISNFKAITKAIEALLVENLDGGVMVTRNKELNTDPNEMVNGWIGIYRHTRNLEPHTLGSASPWMGELVIDIVCQAARMDSEDAAEDALDDLEQAVLKVFNDNKKLSNTVDMTNGMELVYDSKKDGALYCNQVTIGLHVEVRE